MCDVSSAREADVRLAPTQDTRVAKALHGLREWASSSVKEAHRGEMKVAYKQQKAARFDRGRTSAAWLLAR